MDAHPLQRTLVVAIACCIALPLVATAAEARHDFDGDGRSDLLWRNTATGKTVIWHNGVATDAVVLDSSFGAQWQLAAIGHTYAATLSAPDLIWRNPATGQTQIWYAANRLQAYDLSFVDNASHPVDLTSGDIAGFDDYPGYTGSTLLWRDRVDGTVALVFANGFDPDIFGFMPVGPTAAPCCGILGTSPSPAWAIAGSGDFDGDGAAEILWRNPATGANAFWKIRRDGDALVVHASALRRVGPTWQVAGIGDFDADGSADILWRNPRTGANALWPAAQSNAARLLASARPGWRVATILDLDGDGRADIVWRHPTTGANVVWRSGDAATATPLTGVTNPAWQIVP